MSMGIIPASMLEHYADASEYTVIDLRDCLSYERAHIPGAVNIPYSLLMSEYQKMPKNKIYVLYCEHGGTSLMAAREMAEKGFEVLSAAGGFLACGLSKKRLY